MRTDPIEAARFYLQGLASLHLGRAVPAEAVSQVLHQAPPIELPAGQVVFRQGEPADSALLVVHGELAVFIDGPEGRRQVGQVGAWDVVGETALYASSPTRSATVRSSRDSTCLVITTSLFHAAADNPVIAALEYHLLHTLTQRIRSTNQGIQDVWRELDGEAPAQGDERVRLLELLGSRA